DLLSCHANNNAQPPAFDDLVLLAALSGRLATVLGIARCVEEKFGGHAKVDADTCIRCWVILHVRLCFLMCACRQQQAD
ncbi:hypothetical protein ABXT34_18400, partial [Ralstonia sp. SM1884_UCD616_TZ26]|uniref:hypothetical protein n=1 Tax=Ralstonia pseudosolanacearum TaxID=1310165 RepID=UPI003399974B